MLTVEPATTVNSLPEVAWLIEQGRQMIDEEVEPPAEVLREFWKTTRQLQKSWDWILEEGPLAVLLDTKGFEEALARLFATELLARLWGTIEGCIDERTGRTDRIRVTEAIIKGLTKIRHRLLVTTVTDSTLPSSWASKLDRLHRRYDRWTDLLIGNICGTNEFFQFAINPDRARDFAEEARDGADPRSVIMLLEVGASLSLHSHLPEMSLEEMWSAYGVAG